MHIQNTTIHQTSLYTRIIKKWEECGNWDPFQNPPHLVKETQAMEEQLAARFQEPIQQLQDGLISATEFVRKIIWEASGE